MDIRGWPFDRIMQLPDCCFGRRFVVFVEAKSENKAIVWDISELALPERCVLWSVAISIGFAGLAEVADHFRLALGDQLPTAAAMMDALEPLLPGYGYQSPEPRYVHAIPISGVYHMRNPIAAAGRRVVLEFVGLSVAPAYLSIGCEVSSIPTEVPDWLCSGNLRSP